MSHDFRAEAASATQQRVADCSGAAISTLADSGCIRLPGGRGAHCWIELPTAFLSLGSLLFVVLVSILSFTRMLPSRQSILLLLLGLALSLLVRGFKAVILKAYLSSRPDSLLKVFPDLPQRVVGLEEEKTVKRVKWVTEDSGICLLDRANQRLLLEGCEYRYLIRAKDVTLVEPISGYALSGARLICRIAGHDLEMVMKVAGQGPLASLVHSFAPHTGASSLATDLIRTLFWADRESFAQQPLPPPLPRLG